MRRESFFQSIGSALMWKGLGKIVALIKHIIIASCIGLSVDLDVFYMSMGILSLIIFSWAGMLDVVSVPKLSEYHNSGDTEGFRKLSNELLLASTVIGFLICVFSILTLKHICKVAIGFDARTADLLYDALILMLPVAIVYLPIRQIIASFKASRNFSISYRSDFISVLIVLAMVIAFNNYNKILYLSYTLAIYITFIYLLFEYIKQNGVIYLTAKNKFEYLKPIISVAPKLLILQIVINGYILVDRVFISFLPEGSIGALSYAWTIICLVPSLLNTGGSFIPVFSERSNNEDNGAKIIDDLLSFSLLISIPTVVFIFFNSEKIVELFFQRGLFTSADTKMVAIGVCGYSMSVFALMFVDPLDQIFQVKEKISVIIARMSLGIVINIILKYILVFIFNYGIIGISISTSISYSMMIVLGMLTLPKIGININSKRHIMWTFKLIILSIASLAVSKIWELFFSNIALIITEAITFFIVFTYIATRLKSNDSEILKIYLARVYAGLMQLRKRVII